jgi:hypothetical protein
VQSIDELHFLQLTSPRMKARGLHISDYVTMMAGIVSMLEQDLRMQVLCHCFGLFNFSPVFFADSFSMLKL